MNNLTIIGNLTHDPETRSTNSGKTVCVFTVAVNDGDKSDFFRINAWDKLGSTCQQYLSKGRKVAVNGSVRLSTFSGKDGQMRANMDVTAKSVEFLSPKEDAPKAKKPEQMDEQGFVDMNMSELPF